MSKLDSWHKIIEFMENNKDLVPYLTDATFECAEKGIFDLATVYIVAMEKVLEDAADGRDRISY